MTSEINTGKKLNAAQRMQVFALLARGDNSTEINRFLKKNYDITLTPKAYTDMRQRNRETIEAMRSTIVEHQALEAEALMQKSRKILNRKLDIVSSDIDRLEEAKEMLANGDIDHKEFQNIKMQLDKVNLVEISNVSKSLFDQTKLASSDDETRAPASNALQTEALLKAIKNGDTVELQRIILNPGENSGPASLETGSSV